MQQLLKIVGLVFVCFWVQTGRAQIVVDNNWSYQFVEEKCQILPMLSEADFPNDSVVRGRFDASFQPFNALMIAGKESQNWLKINVENKTDRAQALFVGTTRFEYLTIWIQTDTSVLGPFHNGQKVPTMEKSVKINGISFHKHTLEKGAKATFYLKVVNKNAPITPQQVVPLIMANEKYFHENYEQVGNYTYMFLGAVGIMFIFNLLLYFTTRLTTYLYYSLYILCATFFAIGLIPQFANALYGHMDVNQMPISTAGTLATIFYILVAQGIMEVPKYYPKANKFLNFLIVVLLVGLITGLLELTLISSMCNFLSAFTMYPTVLVLGVLMVRKKHIPGTFFFVAILLFFSGIMILLLSLTSVLPPVIMGITGVTFYHFGLVGELALFSLGIGVKINEMQNLKKQEEFERLKAEQLLVENVEISRQRQKAEKALADLKVTQNQLIQKEKLASLGELTAGIAHEIQNPLNFVNNFSELSVGIAQDLSEELHKPTPDQAYIDELLADLTQNQEKINHHGKRASSIVRGMLEHSHMSKGERVWVDMNTLCDEYLRLAFHGMRAKDKTFNADYKVDLAADLPKIQAIPQDMGRVLLNLINNAFYAVNEKAHSAQKDASYTPSVMVRTRQVGKHVAISIIDNGTGIPNNIKSKIFQPFFTTKPTGEGTGLGLSLSYEIVTKGHGGTLEVTSTEGGGTEFTISLPIS